MKPTSNKKPRPERGDGVLTNGVAGLSIAKRGRVKATVGPGLRERPTVRRVDGFPPMPAGVPASPALAAFFEEGQRLAALARERKAQVEKEAA